MIPATVSIVSFGNSAIASLSMLSSTNAIDCAGKVHIARGVEAGLQDASNTSAVMTTGIVNRMSQRRKHRNLLMGVSSGRNDFAS